eukprot:TRINITY_DN9017_c0_g2_i1.p1 TRINITY_DN9017_c0_g2~~TRINITY_DN9017_c0_g2_i1.p1  ORF type:complete len:801 (-),score=212.25 TRINITY_DN9017_c0_g2_i1:204-2606(-)
MAGEVFQVFGQLKWGPAPGCPPELCGQQVRLKCKDGDELEVSAEVACIALRIRSIALERGCREAMEFPLTKAIMSKVIEYLKHHLEHSVCEIQTPLVGDNLQDCGATRWDASYANVDKDTVYDLTVAASCLDIPSLFHLLSAKAALMTQYKSADKLRKEYAMTNDLPASEESELRREYSVSQRRRGNAPDTDLGQLAAGAVQRSGLDRANRKMLAQELQDSDNAVSSSVDFKSWRQALWRAAVLDDWRLLAKAPEEVRDDEQLLRGAIMASMGEALQHASVELQRNEQLVLEATSYSGKAFAFAHAELRSNKDFVLKAVGAHGGALAAASDEFRGDPLLLRTMAQQGHGAALQGAKPTLRRDQILVLEMVADDAETLKHASEDLQQDRDFILQVAKRNGKALKFMLPKFKADPEIVRAAVSRDPVAAVHAHASRRAEMGFIDSSLQSESQLKQELEAQREAAVQAASGEQELILCSKHLVKVMPDSNKPCTCMKLCKTVVFTALSSFFGNIGQGNYTAANSWLDKLAGFERPEIDAVGLMWGAVGHIGMRFKAFASMDALNSTPEALLTIEDAQKILHIACCTLETPEWFAANHFDEFTRSQILQPTAGQLQSRAAGETAAASLDNEREDRDRRALQNATHVDRRPLPGSPGFPELENSPLGGWPKLVGSGAAAGDDGSSATPSFAVGMRVRLVGLKGKDGITGVLVQQAADGKWKVKLDDGSGSALLRANLFQAVHDHEQRAGARERQYEERLKELDANEEEMRKAKIASRRAELKNKIAARQSNAIAQMQRPREVACK